MFSGQNWNNLPGFLWKKTTVFQSWPLFSTRPSITSGVLLHRKVIFLKREKVEVFARKFRNVIFTILYLLAI